MSSFKQRGQNKDKISISRADFHSVLVHSWQQINSIVTGHLGMEQLYLSLVSGIEVQLLHP